MGVIVEGEVEDKGQDEPTRAMREKRDDILPFHPQGSFPYSMQTTVLPHYCLAPPMQQYDDDNSMWTTTRFEQERQLDWNMRFGVVIDWDMPLELEEQAEC